MYLGRVGRNLTKVGVIEQYQPFSLVTRSSLKHVLKELSLPVDDQAIEKLMEAYDSLSIFSDVALALETIAKTPWIIPVVFSNGTYDMVRNSLYSSPDLSPYASVFKEIVSVDDVKCFKPSPNVYYHLAEQLGKSKEDMGSMWLISGNPFDVVGARAVGMQAAWVNRGGGAWVDEMAQGTERGPTIVISGLGEVLNGVKELTFG